MPLLFVMAVGLALRLLALQQAADMLRLPGDEAYYVSVARALVAEGRHPGSFRAPGYPFFMSLIFRLAGPTNLQAVRIAQILLALLSIGLVHSIARQAYGRRAAFWSALAMAVTPNLVHFTLFLWAETLFIALLLLALWLLQRYDIRQRALDLALAGLTLAAAALARESILPFLPVVLAWVLLRPATLSQRCRAGALFLACVLLPILPWTLRNYREHDSLMLISSCRWYPIAEGNDEYPRIHSAQGSLMGQSLSETQTEAYWKRFALDSIARQQPTWILHKLVQNVPHMLSPRTQLVRFVESRWYPQYSPAKRRLLLAIEVGGHFVALFLGALGLCLARAGRLKTLILLYVGYTFALHVIANADTRFLVPLLPLAFLCVGPVFVGGTALLRTRGRRLLAMGVAVGTVALALLRISDVRAAWNLTPNVLLISIDTLRADHLHCYGYARRTSPFIDSLAARGTLFERAISPTAWTLPGHASMLSGLLPRHHGALFDNFRIAPEATWLPEHLRARGYATHGIVNGPFVQEGFGFPRGFDSYTYVLKREWRQHQLQALDTLAAQGADRPFFLFVHYMSVHSPYRPPRRFDVFSRPYSGPFTGDQEQMRKAARGLIPVNEKDRDFLVDRYDGAILAVDARVRELSTQLRKMHVDENTIVIVTADHGEEFLDHGSLLHNKTLYEELIHVPLIVSGPGVPSRLRVKCLATLMDIAPTVAALTGAPALNRTDGRDLAPVWRGAVCEPREIELFSSYPEGQQPIHGLSTQNGKLVHDLTSRKTSFFDLATDPLERMDRQPSTEAARLETILRGLPPVTASSARAGNLNADTEAQLRELGYLDPAPPEAGKRVDD
jgi:arylsulfatase A-like enzyme/4-amino-4-deoxy-L-arabinose transferase-like glycosyltransferase